MKSGENEVNNPPFRWYGLNEGIFFFVFIPFSCWLYGGIPFTGILLGSAVVMGVLAGLFDKLQRAKGKFGRAGRVTRIIAVVLAVSAFVIPFGRSHFNHTKVMYPVKRAMYTGGFMTEDYFYLPHSLPKKCGDYICITEFSTIAQDSHASAYLAFYTDDDGIGEYQAYFTEKGYVHCTEDSSSKTGIPNYVLERIGTEYTADVKDPELYTYSTGYQKGFFCDKGTGLVIIWT